MEVSAPELDGTWNLTSLSGISAVGWSGQRTQEVAAENLAPGGMQLTWKAFGHLEIRKKKENKSESKRGTE